jgi:glycosyltransferase involved in cell wall biosynthesis
VAEKSTRSHGCHFKKEPNMNVLFVTGAYPPVKCGVGAYTQRLACALADLNDIRVTVLTDVRAIGATEQHGVEILPVIRGWRLIELIRIAKVVKKIAPDLVHVQYPTQGYSGNMPRLMPLLMRLLGMHCVQTWHEPILGRSGLWLLIGLDVLITVREELMSSLPKFTQKALSNTKLSWIPAASILPTVSLCDDERSRLRQQYVSDDKKLLVYYGFVALLKGIEVLLEIVVKTNTKLMMACDLDPMNDYHRSLLNRISAMGIASRVVVLGFLENEELANLLAIADAVVLPFKYGAQDCNTSIDGAAAQGTFVLTTSLVHSGYKKCKNIYYAKPGNVDEMVASIEKFAGCRSLSIQSTSKWRDIAKQHLSIYKQVVLT